MHYTTIYLKMHYLTSQYCNISCKVIVTKIVTSLLRFVKQIRSGEFKTFKRLLHIIINIFLARNLP